MNRAIHAETLKTRLDNDAMLTGYLDEMINDCPSVRPDTNSLADEVFTVAVVNGELEDVERELKGLTGASWQWYARHIFTGGLANISRDLNGAAEKIYNELRKTQGSTAQEAMAEWNDRMVDALVQILCTARFLHIDVERILRRKMKEKSDASTGD